MRHEFLYNAFCVCVCSFLFCFFFLVITSLIRVMMPFLYFILFYLTLLGFRSYLSQLLYVSDSVWRISFKHVCFFIDFFFTENVPCPPNYFKCTDSYCIPMKNVCNGRIDCRDGQDEQYCGNELQCTFTQI
jgi:hypothetical protein